MHIRKILYLLLLSIIFSCSEDNDVFTPRNLAEYITTISNKERGNVIACAASANGNTSVSYIFYYPEEGATDIRYYEAESVSVDENDFSKYRRVELTIEDVFGGKLQRFSRNNAEENWCLVTYMLNGKLHMSNPIRLKNVNDPTGYTDQVTIEYPSTLIPKFTWSDFGIANNEVYFQVVSENDSNAFLSGTYTAASDNEVFQYQEYSNVNQELFSLINTTTPPDLVIDTEYLFTLMAVTEDNWVNFVIEETFVLQNLQEFLDAKNTNTTETITSFAASEDGNNSLSYIYYYPKTNARDFRYYETENISVDETDFTNYRRKMLTDEATLAAQFRRFSRTDDEESWYIVTYEIDEVVYKTEPIQLRNSSQPTVWQTTIETQFPETLKPNFTWSNFGTTNNLYFHLLTDSSSTFVSGIYTQNTSFNFYDTSNTISQINTTTPDDLILEDQYRCTVLGISAYNWVNLVIEDSFVVE
ncbi:hypothetical protein [Polaribacter porphyrae]|uniref:DUF4249 domain-containing protein n=1 Tax=Polaribacter porphyrae TaxID=1137780 RepID=A0A2S7WPI6_9FLAO|nr:hypothetical protein [Polaribacter porphyrae]PQJ79517.1 hypothetical protein BTO18_10185 [Polaribacter porphyrae]